MILAMQTLEYAHCQPGNTVVGFSGSPRKYGNSDILLKTVGAGVKQENVAVECWNLTDIHFTGCIGCEKCRQTNVCSGLLDGMSLMYPRIYAAKGLILVSPTHNYNVTSWVKAFIDRLYCFYDFAEERPGRWSSRLAQQNRKAVIAAICEQPSIEDMGFTVEAMKKPLEDLGYEIVGDVVVLNTFAKAKVQHDSQAMEDAFRLGQILARSLQ